MKKNLDTNRIPDIQSGRPKFPFQERIIQDLANLGFSNLAYKSIDGFSNAEG